MSGDEIASGHGEEVDDTIDSPSRVEGRLPGDEREHVSAEDSSASDRQEQSSRERVEVSRHSDFEGRPQRDSQDANFVQHLRPDDNQPPLVGIAGFQLRLQGSDT
jgi:hypothetical protein